MAFVIDALAVADQQYLWGFVVDAEEVGHFIGHGTVADQVEEIEVDGFGLFGSFQPSLYHGACRAAGAVFKNYLGAAGGSFPDLFQLGLGL